MRTARRRNLPPAAGLACGLLLAAPAPAAAAEPIPPVPPPSAADLPPVAEVLAASAERRLPREEIRRLRGGFLLASSVAMDLNVDFAASVNGSLLDIADYPSGYSGIMLGVVDGTAQIVGTNDFQGVISNIQNSLNFQDIQTLTRLDVDLSGSLAAFRAGTLTSEISYLRASGL